MVTAASTPGCFDPMSGSEEHQVELVAQTTRVSAALKEAAEAWGADWQEAIDGGRLTLPTLTGLRRGVLVGRVTVQPAGRGSRIVFRIEESAHRINRPATVILLMGAIGGVSIVLWPFYPPLLGFAPVGVVLAFAAWLLVASRLRHSGPEDFFELVRRLAEAEEDS